MSTQDLDQIERLFRLRERGALTQAEFEAEKARILGVASGDILTVESDAERPEEGRDEADSHYPSVQDERSSYRSRSAVVPIIFAAILITVLWAGWHAMRNASLGELPEVTMNEVSQKSSVSKVALNNDRIGDAKERNADDSPAIDESRGALPSSDLNDAEGSIPATDAQPEQAASADDGSPQNARAGGPSGAKAIGDEAAWVTVDDYPPSSLRSEEEGTVTIKWDVNEAGRVENCLVVASSGYQSLDQAACRAIMNRGRYSPAIDNSGNPTRATFSRRVTWKMPITSSESE